VAGVTNLQISADLPLPRTAVTSTLLVYGGKGMGKSNFGSVLLEEMSAAGLRWSAIDPMGVLWGIRHSVDGKGRGIECLILGGAHGDIPLEPTGGAIIADLVVDNDANVIIDISRKPSGEMWGVGERIRFVTDYGRRLFAKQGSLVEGQRREPLFQLIDEAARFMPQMIRAGEPDLAKCLSVWATIVEEGRNIGLGVGIVTQRSARINKDVAELADLMLAFRTVGPNSIAAVMDWLGEHIPRDQVKTMIEQIRALPVGSALAVSPGWLKQEKVIRIRPRQTFDSSATPKPGEQQKKVSGQGAQPDLKKYAALMKETIEKAEKDDPKVLCRKIAELERAANQAVPKDSEETKRRLAAAEEDIRKLTQSLSEAQLRCNTLQGYVAALQKIQVAAEVMQPLDPIAVARSEYRNPVMPKLKPRSEWPKPFKPVAASSNGHLRAGARRMLAVLAQWSPSGRTESQVAAQVQMKKTGGTWSAYKSDLRNGGYFEVRGDGLWYATEAGREYVGADAPDMPSTTEEVVELWGAKLRRGAREMLDVLVRHKGRAIDKGELGQAVNMEASGGTFSAYLSDLKQAGLIVVDRDGVRANAETLFL
jgi:uncharacterized protein